MNDSQKISYHSHLLSYVKKFTSIHWGKLFVTDLLGANNSVENLSKIKLLDDLSTVKGSNIVRKDYKAIIIFKIVDFGT